MQGFVKHSGKVGGLLLIGVIKRDTFSVGKVFPLLTDDPFTVCQTAVVVVSGSGSPLFGGWGGIALLYGSLFAA